MPDHLIRMASMKEKVTCSDEDDEAKYINSNSIIIIFMWIAPKSKLFSEYFYSSVK